MSITRPALSVSRAFSNKIDQIIANSLRECKKSKSIILQKCVKELDELKGNEEEKKIALKKAASLYWPSGTTVITIEEISQIRLLPYAVKAQDYEVDCSSLTSEEMLNLSQYFQCGYLLSLSLDNVSFFQPHLSMWLRHNKTLTTLIVRSSSEDTCSIFKSLTQHPTLQSLELDGVGYCVDCTYHDPEVITNMLDQNSEIKKLELLDTFCLINSVRLMTMIGYSSLTKLIINSCYLEAIHQRELFEGLARNTTLTSLEIKGNEHFPSALKYIKNTALQKLVLEDGGKISEVNILLQNNPLLRVLHFSNYVDCDANAAYLYFYLLQKIIQESPLEELGIFWNFNEEKIDKLSLVEITLLKEIEKEEKSSLLRWWLEIDETADEAYKPKYEFENKKRQIKKQSEYVNWSLVCLLIAFNRANFYSPFKSMEMMVFKDILQQSIEKKDSVIPYHRLNTSHWLDSKFFKNHMPPERKEETASSVVLSRGIKRFREIS